MDISLAGRAAGPAELAAGVQTPDRSFVGRSTEMRSLLAELSQVRAGTPRLIVVEGPAGVGKTALVRRFLAEAGDLRALAATGEEVEALLPYGIVEQLIRAAGGPVPERLRGLAAPGVQAPDPISVGAGLVELLGAQQSGAVIALVIDDAQWADRPSLQALLFALRRLHADRVLALISAREGATGELFSGLHRLVDNGRGTRVRLQGLDSVAIRELAVAMGVGHLSVRATERIREHTQGSPLHVQ
ncbi:MAG: ATP-binding protein, partial [Solirubrobacterales bacterium]|nr:ATP-binding protein [Solirubrobacterales bacterium]